MCFLIFDSYILIRSGFNFKTRPFCCLHYLEDIGANFLKPEIYISILYTEEENMINRTTVLLIQDNLKTVSELTEKCLEAGISEKNIFSVSDAQSAERYLEIAGISYIIVDADLYNFVLDSIIEKFNAYFPIQTIIINGKPEQITLRMLNNKSLTYVNSLEEIPDLLKGSQRNNIYFYSEEQNFQNI